MKTNFIIYCVAILLGLIFMQCHDNLDAIKGKVEEGAEVLGRGNPEVDEGCIYLNQRFFLKSTDGKMSGITRSTGNRLLTRSYSINQMGKGEYYLGVHVFPANVGIDGKTQLQEVFVYINGEEVGALEITKDSWEFVTLKEKKTVHLDLGENIITFASEAPFYPEIDAIQVESSVDKLMTKDPQYEVYLAHLKSSTGKSSAGKIEQWEVDAKLQRNTKGQTRSAINPGNWSWQVTPVTFQNPDGNYAHKMNVPITYTYHRKLSLSAGTHTFHTATTAGETNTVDPYMYLYKIDDPHNHSYYDDDGAGNLHSRISVNLPAGDYYLVVRAYSSAYASSTTGRQGLIDVYQNGTRINTGAPIAGYMVDADTPYTGLMNFFTAYTVGIPEIYLEEKGTNKLKFFGETMFYVPPMDFMWWDDARMRITKNSSAARYRMLITSVGAFGAYYGNCDVYGMVPQGFRNDGVNVANYFPNLKDTDCMYSGIWHNTVYNCASWAGGLTNGWMWGNDPLVGGNIGQNYGHHSVWSTWDNYFGNNPPRYSGATTYTRDQADSNNGEIAVWSKTANIFDVTHFSVRGTANNHPHGYAWESKPGSLIRTFHPRDALSGAGYGQIIGYYRDANKDPYQSVTRSLSMSVENISFEESLEKGLTVVEKVDLSPEYQLILSAKNKSVGRQNNTIQTLYNNWKQKCNSSEFLIVSNPYEFLKTTEAKELIQYCKQNKDEALLFFTGLYFISEEDDVPKHISYSIFCEIFMDEAEVMEDIKKQWTRNQYNEEGAYIAPLPETFAKKYVKSLFERKFIN